LSRFEGDFAAAGKATLDARELLDLLAGCPDVQNGERRQAIACYLSASEGWDEALKRLRGAFASDAAEAVRQGRIKRDKRAVNQRASEYLQWPALKPAGTDND
jgi:hypothetical protein